jgi:phosphatidate cytidylyltransferase
LVFIAVIYDSNRHFDAILEEQFMVFAFAFSISLLSLLKTPEDDAVLEKMSSTVFGFVYVYMPFVYIILIRGLGIHSEDGIIYLLFVVLVAKSTDIGGYMVGYAFGKHKLCPSISPKKSWEGFAGGILLSIAVAFILRWQIGLLGETVSVLHTLLFASIVSLLSLLGDLSESLVKRKCDVKDSGNLIPEFGGILDMLDSFIFVAPFSFYYLKAIL